MSTDLDVIQRSGLAWRLVREQMVPEDVMASACRAAATQKTSLVTHLVEQGTLTSREIAVAAAGEFGVPLLDLSAFDAQSALVGLVEGKLLKRHHAIPLCQRGNRLFLGVSDPTVDEGFEEIRFQTGLNISPILVEEDKLVVLLNKLIEAQDTSGLADFKDEELEELDIDQAEESESISEANVDEAPIVRYVNKVLFDAIRTGASDVHFEPFERLFRVRFRHDGILHEVAKPPLGIAERMTARLKVMSRMNIAERRVPQDGRIKLKLSATRDIDFRVNTLPTLYGEKVVLRILDSSAAQVGVEALGFEPEQREIFLNAIHKPYGMILVTGPTGSGKTVSLYSALNLLNTPEVNISTVEDPVEIQVAGINQVNMNLKTGLTFASALRAFLRQDPDIIMVGEIRDLETAEIAVKAAQTGHLVLSTLHTNDAPQSLTRLANMGVPPFNIASSVLLIMAQRLARRLCKHCKKPVELPREALLLEGFTEEEINAGLELYGPVGCDQCNRGYRGRTGIFQVMSVSEDISRLILEGGNSMQLAEQAKREGIADLRRSGLRKVIDGVTSLEEINRITKD